MKNKKIRSIVCILFLLVLLIYPVSAGVGIKWDRESALASGGERACLTYGVYNPWPEESYVKVSLSDELLEVLDVQDTEAVLIPSNTPSGAAIPIEFCFEVPEKIYEKDCWIGSFFVCEQECKEEQRVYEGDVEVTSVAPPEGVEGSAAIMAVSAPLRVKVRCDPFERDYTLLYVLIGVISVVIIFLLFRKKYGKSKEERLRDKMKALKSEMNSIKKK
ncbi:hypothetical protein J4462_02595 [Candidatus Pacearchaeota archaeon]|nr:hypothetical protein [Candidatus Pacearchaeota archaeon]